MCQSRVEVTLVTHAEMAFTRHSRQCRTATPCLGSAWASMSITRTACHIKFTPWCTNNIVPTSRWGHTCIWFYTKQDIVATEHMAVVVSVVRQVGEGFVHCTVSWAFLGSLATCYVGHSSSACNSGWGRSDKRWTDTPKGLSVECVRLTARVSQRNAQAGQ